MTRAYVPLVHVSPRIQDINAAIAAIPMVAELRREHAIALVRPMVGCPWVGEPSVDLTPSANSLMPLPAWFDWEMGRYAAALLRKREPAFASGDLSHLRIRFEPPASVLFVTDVRCRCSRRYPDGRKTIAVAEVLLPDHALGRGPRALPSPPGTPQQPFPREVPSLGAPSIPPKDPAMKFTTDNPPSRKRTAAARVTGGRS